MNRRHPIYLDYNATTPVDPRVVRVIAATLETTFGNPHSLDHSYGQAAREVVTVARDRVAELVGAQARAVVFTSGATEAIRLALDHARSALAQSRPLRIVSSPVEHRAMLEALSHLERSGRAVVRYLSVDRAGRIDLDELVAACGAGTDLVSLMAANNEVGTTYPIQRIAEVAAAAGAATLIDGTQAVGKIPLDVDRWGLTYLCLSGHKLYGPKGVGALIVGRSSRWLENNDRGTPNVPGIAGLGEACHLRGLEMAEDETRIAALRDRLSSLLRAAIPDLVENGDVANRLAGSLHISVPGIPNGPILARLHDRVAISSGSACRSGAEAPSHVLTAMGLSEPLLGSALRISLGKFTTDGEVATAAGLIAQAVNEVRDALS